MKATLTELRRNSAKVIKPVVNRRKKVTLTDRGEPVAEIVPCQKVDYAQAWKDLIAIGPVDFVPRK
jgi:prevent-host-death family protein